MIRETNRQHFWELLPTGIHKLTEQKSDIHLLIMIMIMMMMIILLAPFLLSSDRLLHKLNIVDWGREGVEVIACYFVSFYFAICSILMTLVEKRSKLQYFATF
jgi:hypothetical protein